MSYEESSKDWRALNLALQTATEAECARLLRKEKAGRKRRYYLLRIQSRLNAVRSKRERRELLDVSH